MSDIRLSIERRCFPHRFDPHESEALETWRDVRGAPLGMGVQRGQEYWLRIHHVGTFIIQPNSVDTTAYPADPDADLKSFEEAFFHSVAPWILQRQGWDCLHGSAVRVGEEVAAFCGPAERGKSTLARAWCECGAAPYADDAVPFLLKDGAVMAARLPQRLQPREPAASRYQPTPAPDSGSIADGKLVVDLRPSLRPMVALYWLEGATAVNGGVVSIERVAPADAFPLLLTEAHVMSLRDADRNRKMIQNYLALAERVPVFRLSIRRGLHLLPAVLDRLERHQRGLAQR